MFHQEGEELLDDSGGPLSHIKLRYDNDHISVTTGSAGRLCLEIKTHSHFISTWKFVYQHEEEGPNFQKNMPGIF